MKTKPWGPAVILALLSAMFAYGMRNGHNSGSPVFQVMASQPYTVVVFFLTLGSLVFLFLPLFEDRIRYAGIAGFLFALGFCTAIFLGIRLGNLISLAGIQLTMNIRKVSQPRNQAEAATGGS